MEWETTEVMVELCHKDITIQLRFCRGDDGDGEPVEGTATIKPDKYGNIPHSALEAAVQIMDIDPKVHGVSWEFIEGDEGRADLHLTTDKFYDTDFPKQFLD